jgi:hypothetical protein
MRQKPGLHKKISSIFDGIPVPQSGQEKRPPTDPKQPADSARKSSSNTNQQNNQQYNTQPHQKPAPPKPKLPMPAPMKKTPTPQSQPPVQPKPKPTTSKPQAQPLPKIKSAASVKQSSSFSKIKNFVVSLQDGTEEARQRKMAVLVGLLSIVMVCVLFFVLKGPEKSHATPVRNTTSSESSNQTQTWQISWTAPEEYPDTLRDPMQYRSTTSEPTTNTQLSQLTVTGIVFSSENPSAIISGKIVSEGEKIQGITIVKINKETVEFEKDGKTWTQPVQR